VKSLRQREIATKREKSKRWSRLIELGDAKEAKAGD